jgi:fumarate hydratase class II
MGFMGVLMNMRLERDSMGEKQVPQDALWGASTQRAVENFSISSLRLSQNFIACLGMVKLAAAHANISLGLLDRERGDAIILAAREVVSGLLYRHFVVDLFQTGSGTSTNMNANEVIANRALEALGRERGAQAFIHPNDHVNMCQSSNDVFPTTIHIAIYESLSKRLSPLVDGLQGALDVKQREFAGIVKAGRTHLQDATPITLGQEFSGYAAQMRQALERLKRSSVGLLELALGGTTVGTGVNAHPEFAGRAIAFINQLTGSSYREAENHFAAQSTQDVVVEISGQLRCMAVSLMKIANDIRWLASGPRCGLGELSLPSLQPGSSSMPAKVNPVICEAVMMVCAQVMGNDSTVVVCAQHGNFELNTMMPVLAYNVLQSIDLLSNATATFSRLCIAGISANAERCRSFAERSLAVVTAVAPVVGHDAAAEIVGRALREDRGLREVTGAMHILKEGEIDRVFDLMAMTKPGRPSPIVSPDLAGDVTAQGA